MRTRRLIAGCLALACGLAIVEAGELKPFACDPDEALHAYPLYVSRSPGLFTPRVEGDGTVSRHAVIATVFVGHPAAKVALDAEGPEEG